MEDADGLSRSRSRLQVILVLPVPLSLLLMRMIDVDVDVACEGEACQSCIGRCLKYRAVWVIDTLDQRVHQGTHIGIACPARCQ
jgi:hypothetical protein